MTGEVTATRFGKLGEFWQESGVSRARRYTPVGIVFHVLSPGVTLRVLFHKDDDVWTFERGIEESLPTRPTRQNTFTVGSHEIDGQILEFAAEKP